MKRRGIALGLSLCLLLGLGACAGREPPGETAATVRPEESEAFQGTGSPGPAASPEGTPEPVPEPTGEPGAEPTAAPTPTPEPTRDPAGEAVTDEEISHLYVQAIRALEPTVTLNVAGREWKYGAENDLKNLYYGVLSQDRELKYAYDMTARVEGDRAECSFSYMPYKTGVYGEGFPAGSHSVGSLHDMDVMAQSMTGGVERLPIAITDPGLGVEELQLAAGQGGYGWIVCSLSKDGTELLAAPAPTTGMTLDRCVEQVEETFRLAEEILGEIIAEEMTDREKAEAAYTYITENVVYDFRYYSGKNDMPFESTVALGALRDNLAICGGYSHALETLLDLCGIENYTVSGVWGGEYHAWNYVVLDGEGYYCDPTGDRGGWKNRFLLTGEELKAAGRYEWDGEFYPRLLRT